MADTFTPILNLTKPEIGSSAWGPKINANLDKIDVAAALPMNYLTGLDLVNAADGDHDITLLVGECRDGVAFGGGNTGDMRLISSITKQIDAVWVVGTNQGGLDTGTVAASTWYHMWLIKRTDSGVVDALFSLSATSPTLPTGYTLKRRIGSVHTDASANIESFSQTGDEFIWTNTTQTIPRLDETKVNPGISASTFGLDFVPDGIRAIARLAVKLYSTGTTETALTLYQGALSGSAIATVPVSYFLVNTGSVNTRADGGQIDILLTSGTIGFRLSFSDAVTTIYFNVIGWQDRRGRDGWG